MSEATASRVSRLAAKRGPSAPEHASERLQTGYPGLPAARHQAGDESGQV
jgi:hypothetical protein